MTEIPLIALPDRGHFGPRVRVEFERDILLTILQASGPELGRLDSLRMERQAAGNRDEHAMLQTAGVAANDVIRLLHALRGDVESD